MTVSQTSREAYHALDLTRKELQVMSAFTGPSSTYTRQSLAEAIGEPLGSVCGRVNALLKKGALAACGYQLNQPTRTRRELLALPEQGCFFMASGADARRVAA